MATSAAKRGYMRAYEIGDQSQALTLHMVERPIPTPAPGQVLIKVNATGLNARDLFLLRQKNKPKHIPLCDNVGTIAGFAPDVTGFTLGERVTVGHYSRWLAGEWDEDYNLYDIGWTIDGFLAEYAVANANAVVKISNRLPDEEAATVTSAGVTAWRALTVEAKLLPGETVLTLGTGGVSVFGLQLAKIHNARVIITSSSDEKLERMKALGADMTVNYKTSPDWAKEVMTLTGGKGADVIMNNVGYSQIESCFVAAGNNARYIHIGTNQQPTEIKPMTNFFVKDCSIKGIANASRAMLADFLRAGDVNGLRPLVDKVFPFEQAIDAVRLMEGSDRIGKIMIKVA